MKLLFYSMLVFLALWAKTQAIDYVAEGLFVVDDKTIAKYMNEQPATQDSLAARRTRAIDSFNADWCYTLTQVNRLLDGFSIYGLNLQVKTRAVIILNEDLFPSSVLVNGVLINGFDALNIFSSYLINTNAYVTYNPDFFMLLTGFDLTGKSGIFDAAFTNAGDMCEPFYALTAVEFNTTYVTVPIIVRQIIYLLGGSLDGLAAQTLMAPYMSPLLTNRWQFGSCTAQEIKDYIALMKLLCLQQTNAASVKPNCPLTTYTGPLYDKDIICKRAYNDSRSYACLSRNLYGQQQPKGNGICNYIYCLTPGSNNMCTPEYPSDGMVCDTNKRCDKGLCRPYPDSVSGAVNTNCVLGDQKEIVLVGENPYTGTCPNLIAQRGKLMCYNSAVEQLCCGTCLPLKNTNYPGCEYSNKNSACSSLTLTAACQEPNRAICCDRCRNYTPVGKRSADFVHPGALIGEDLANIQGLQFKVGNRKRTISNKHKDQ